MGSSATYSRAVIDWMLSEWRHSLNQRARMPLR